MGLACGCAYVYACDDAGAAEGLGESECGCWWKALPNIAAELEMRSSDDSMSWLCPRPRLLATAQRHRKVAILAGHKDI